MNNEKKAVKNNPTWLPNALYVISGILAVIFVYMLIVNVMYTKNYLASYGMTFSDMWMDSVQYVLTGSISYLVYAILIFCVGRIISMLQAGTISVKAERAEAAAGSEHTSQNAALQELAAAEVASSVDTEDLTKISETPIEPEKEATDAPAVQRKARRKQRMTAKNRRRT